MIFNRHLKAALRRCELDDSLLHDPRWAAFLTELNDFYQRHEDERHRFSRTLEMREAENKGLFRELQQERERLASAVACLKQGFAVLDGQGQIALINCEGEDLLGISEAEGRRLNVLDQLGLPFSGQELLRHLEAGQWIRTQAVLKRRRGQPIQLEISLQPLCRDGQFVGSVLTLERVGSPGANPAPPPEDSLAAVLRGERPDENTLDRLQQLVEHWRPTAPPPPPEDTLAAVLRGERPDENTLDRLQQLVEHWRPTAPPPPPEDTLAAVLRGERPDESALDRLQQLLEFWRPTAPPPPPEDTLAAVLRGQRPDESALDRLQQLLEYWRPPAPLPQPEDTLAAVLRGQRPDESALDRLQQLLEFWRPTAPTPAPEDTLSAFLRGQRPDPDTLDQLENSLRRWRPAPPRATPPEALLPPPPATRPPGGSTELLPVRGPISPPPPRPPAPASLPPAAAAPNLLPPAPLVAKADPPPPVQALPSQSLRAPEPALVENPQPPSPLPRAEIQDFQPNQMRILLVEDEPVSQLITLSHLESLGHRCVVVGDANEAMAHHRRQPFDVIVSSFIMPGMSGVELCRRIRETSRGIYTYFILLTAADKKLEAHQAMAAGVDAFLTKPLDPDELSIRLKVARDIHARTRAQT